MPAHMLRAVQGLYDRDSYVLVDGDKRTAPIFPTRGVKQGCPLSPLLFALYINDFGAHSGVLDREGVPLRTGTRVVSHMFYADDLVLVSGTEAGLQRMLSALESYAHRKGLTVNAGKSEVVVFNSKQVPCKRRAGSEELVCLKYAGQPLKLVGEFRYLGLVLHNMLSMTRTHAPRARALVTAMREMGGMTKELGLGRSVWACA